MPVTFNCPLLVACQDAPLQLQCYLFMSCHKIIACNANNTCHGMMAGTPRPLNTPLVYFLRRAMVRRNKNPVFWRVFYARVGARCAWPVNTPLAHFRLIPYSRRTMARCHYHFYVMTRFLRHTATDRAWQMIVPSALQMISKK